MPREENKIADKLDEDQKYKDLRANLRKIWNILIDMIQKHEVTSTFGREQKMEHVKWRREVEFNLLIE